MKNIIFSLCLFVSFIFFSGCFNMPMIYTEISGIPHITVPSITIVNGGSENIARIIINDRVYNQTIKITGTYVIPISGYGDYFSINVVLITASGKTCQPRSFNFYSGQRKQTWVVTSSDFPQR